jgi:hypothetical protein
VEIVTLLCEMPSPYCKHGRRRRECVNCGGSGICEHNRRRNTCVDCGGSGICEHNRRRTRCVDCGGQPALPEAQLKTNHCSAHSSDSTLARYRPTSNPHATKSPPRRGITIERSKKTSPGAAVDPAGTQQWQPRPAPQRQQWRRDFLRRATRQCV